LHLVLCHSFVYSRSIFVLCSRGGSSSEFIFLVCIHSSSIDFLFHRYHLSRSPSLSLAVGSPSLILSVSPGPAFCCHRRLHSLPLVLWFKELISYAWIRQLITRSASRIHALARFGFPVCFGHHWQCSPLNLIFCCRSPHRWKLPLFLLAVCKARSFDVLACQGLAPIAFAVQNLSSLWFFCAQDVFDEMCVRRQEL
jgi:hypothetical protein